VPADGVTANSFLGDIDRDGLQEIAETFPRPHADSWDNQFVIFSEKTLFVPPTVAVGSNAEVRLSIPSGPGKDFRLLYSERFVPEWGTDLDPDGGVRIGVWTLSTLGQTALSP